MAMIRLLPDFKEFLQLLNENQVEYLLRLTLAHNAWHFFRRFNWAPPSLVLAFRVCVTAIL
jgi:hypothetical protein